MSKDKKDIVKYNDRLNIPSVTISKAKELVKKNIMNTIEMGIENVDKQTFHLIGPAGVGKSKICEQIVSELSSETGINFKMLMVKCPVLSRDDFLMPFPVKDENNNPKFEMLYSNFIPFEENSYGLFVIDEFSRGDHSLQQLLWQIQNDYQVHLKDLPKGWFVISIDNPDEQEYNMNILEDAAGLRRMLHMYIDVSASDFLIYAISQKFHPYVIEFIQAHPDFLYDFASQTLGSVYSNPASWERVSNILKGYQDIENNLDDIEVLCGGLLNVSKTRLFLEYLKNNAIIKPSDIIYKYDEVSPKINKFISSKNNAKLGEIIISFTTYLATSKPKYTEKELDNICKFLTEIPIDTAAVFISQVDNYPKNSEEFAYIGTLHADLMIFPKYVEEFYEPLKNISIKEEKDKN